MRSCFNSSYSLPALLMFSLPESPVSSLSVYSLDCCLTCSSSMELTIRSCFNSSNSLPALLMFSYLNLQCFQSLSILVGLLFDLFLKYGVNNEILFQLF